MTGQPIDLAALADPDVVLYEPTLEGIDDSPEAEEPPEFVYVSVDEEPPFPGESIIGERPQPIHAETGLTTLGWRDLMAQPDEPPPTIAPGIPKVGLTVLAGPPKVGKSLYLTQTALTVGRSLLVFEEGSLSGIAYRLRRQASALGIAEPDLLTLHRQRIRLDDRRSVARLRDAVAEYRPILVGLDPLNRLHGADENRPSQMTPIMDALAGIAYDFALAVVCVHHLGKPSMERRGDIWDRFRGASSIRSGTDANLILDDVGEMRHMVGEFRDAEPLSRYLELDRATLIFSEAEAPEGSGKANRRALADFIRERGRVTAREVMARFNVSKHTALDALEASGADSYPGQRGTLTFYLKEGGE